MTRDSAEGISLVLAIAVTIVTARAPQVLADNVFLVGYVTHEILALLSVTMTITFASVANIHLAISKSLQSSVKDPVKRAQIEKTHGQPMRREVNSSAWLLFWTFLAIFLGVLIKGEWPTNKYVLSAVNGAGVVATVINLLVIRDIYRTTFIMAADPSASTEDAAGR